MPLPANSPSLGLWLNASGISLGVRIFGDTEAADACPGIINCDSRAAAPAGAIKNFLRDVAFASMFSVFADSLICAFLRRTLLDAIARVNGLDTAHRQE